MVPILIANYVSCDREVVYHSENGILEMGANQLPREEDINLINAGKLFVTIVKGGCFLIVVCLLQ